MRPPAYRPRGPGRSAGRPSWRPCSTRSGAPYVVKDDGLAAGKGVLVTDDRAAAVAHGRRVLDAGGAVLVEEYLDGPEVSLFAITDGTTVLPLVPAQDHKRRDDGDGGPNTGGMGAYAPLPWAPPGLVDEVLATVLQPTVDEMARRGETFSGLLYAGLALTSRGVRVVEFNARFGDPETQVVLPLLETPLAGLLHAAATGTLADHPPLRWRDGAAVTVVVAAPGTRSRRAPVDPVTGADGEGVLHAGTALARGRHGGLRRWPGPGRDRGRAPTWRPPGRPPTSGWPGVRLADAHWRTDIALAAVEGRIDASALAGADRAGGPVRGAARAAAAPRADGSGRCRRRSRRPPSGRRSARRRCRRSAGPAAMASTTASGCTRTARPSSSGWSTWPSSCMTRDDDRRARSAR